MNWDQIKGKWTEMSGNAKKTWGKLTDDDLVQADARRAAGVDGTAHAIRDRAPATDNRRIRQC